MKSYDNFNPTIPEPMMPEVNNELPPVNDVLNNDRQSQKRQKKQINNKDKSGTKEKSAKPKKNVIEKINSFASSQSTRWILGLFLGFVGVYLALAFISYLGTCVSDQSEIYNTSIGQAEDISNIGGEGGARISEYLINGCFGLGSFVIIVWLIGMSMKNLMGRPRFKSVNFTIKCLVALITVSLIVGLFTIGSNSSINWGGYHGRYINSAVIHFLGWTGAVILCLFMLACFVVICLRDLINWIIKLRDKRRERNRILAAKKAEERAREKELEEMRRFEDSELNGIQAETGKKDEDNLKTVSFENDGSKFTELDFEMAEYVLPESAIDGEDSLENPDDNNEANDKSMEDADPEKSQSIYYGDTYDDIINEDDGELKGKPSDMEPAEADSNEILSPSEKEDIEIKDDANKTNPMVVNVNEIAQADVSKTMQDHTPMARHPYKFPPFELLREGQAIIPINPEEQLENQDKIQRTLLDFDIPITSIEATVGPTVTLYKIVPDKGVKVAKIKGLVDDMALSLSAEGVRIIAPIPGEGAVGIEVANKNPQTVSMRTVLKSKKFQETKFKLPVAIGSTISNEVYIADLAKMPHLLVAGATGQGKSVGLNAIIASLLYSKTPDELKFVMVDPKMVEFNLYSKIEAHYLAKLPDAEEPIITDMDKVVSTLNSLCVEMDNRYLLLKDAHTRNIEEYNEKIKEGTLDPRLGHRYLPYIVVIVDEFSDLIMTAGKEVEMPIARLAQKARAVGMHVIIATQRPSTNVITGIIKANFPARMAFKVSSGVDSKTILDTPGAQQLIGRGDMLISNSSPMVRVQCAFIDTPEVEAICDYIARQPYAQGAYLLPEPQTAESNSDNIAINGERDALYADAGRKVVASNLGSTSGLQRLFGIGYARAGKIMDQLEADGVVGPSQGGKPRAVLMDPTTFEELLDRLGII